MRLLRAYTVRGVPLVLLRCGIVGVVLAGYVLALSASSAGHGWWLLGHVLTRHHAPAERAEELSGMEGGHTHASPHAAPAPHPHGHGEGGEQGHRHEAVPASVHAGAEYDHAGDAHPVALSSSAHGAHAHGNTVHTHDETRVPEKAQIVVEVSKHCLLPGGAAPVPPGRHDRAYAEALLRGTCPCHGVETPPPRRTV